jgi:hypothetical protein
MNTNDISNTLYLAGPMRGFPLYNFGEFARGAKALRSMGYLVESPAEYDLAKGLNPAEPLDSETNAKVFDINAVLKEDFEIILEKCSGLAMLPGWRKSSGACAEVVVAYYSGKMIWELIWADETKTAFSLVRLTQVPQIRFEDGAEYTGDQHPEAKRGENWGPSDADLHVADRIDELQAIGDGETAQETLQRLAGGMQ